MYFSAFFCYWIGFYAQWIIEDRVYCDKYDWLIWPLDYIPSHVATCEGNHKTAWELGIGLIDAPPR